MKYLDTFGRVLFPNYKTDFIPGAKLYSNEKGTYLEFDFSRPNPLDKPEIILGEFNGLGPVTCVNNEFYGSDMGAGGTRCRYRVDILFTGVHFPKKEDIKFTAGIFYVNSLFEWFNIKTIKQSLHPVRKIEYGTFQEIDLEISGFKNASFNFGYSYQTNRQSVTVSELVTFKLKAINSENLDNFYKIVSKFKKFFSFLSNTKFEISEISVYNENFKHELNGKTIDSLIEIKVYDNRESFFPCPSSEFLNIQYIDIKDQFNDLVNNWLRISEDNIVIDLLMEKAYNQELSVKTYFLNACFALEIYHKNNICNQRLPEEEFKRIIDYLNEHNTDPYVKDWINNKIGLGNHPSFRDRLSYFKKEIGTINSSDLDTLLNKIIYTRNSLVHSSAKSKYIVKDEYELYLISLTLEIVVKAVILKDLGISQENIGKIYNEASIHIRNLLRRSQ